MATYDLFLNYLLKQNAIFVNAMIPCTQTMLNKILEEFLGISSKFLQEKGVVKRGIEFESPGRYVLT